MTTNNQNPPNAGGDDTGSANQNQDGTGGDNTPPNNNAGGEQTVSYATYTKTVDEVKKLKNELKALKNGSKDADLNAAKNAGDVVKVLEIRDSQIKELTDQLNEKETELTTHRKRAETQEKLSSILDVIPGDVPKQYWSLLPLDKIVIDPTTGEADPASVAKAAKAFQDQYAEVIKTKPGGLPSGAPGKGGVGSGMITHADWLKLNSNEKRKFSPKDIVFPKK